MVTDIARRSFDPRRHYIGVVSQQGRVALEAEENEDREISADERRRELLDIIGPTGVPSNASNSYAISQGQAGAWDFTISPGTIYVGGVRVQLDAPVTYSNQPDWLDHPGDPDWVPSGKTGSEPEGVMLVLIEREVTAVEDPMLKEVALGGADGAARRRILQHIERGMAGNCEQLLSFRRWSWAAQGLAFDPSMMQLRSQSRLQVRTNTAQGPGSNPCQPQSQGGYLGAENQVLRVEVVNVQTPLAPGSPVAGVAQVAFDLVWGWDNASFLYAVNAISSGTGPTMLKLATSPVDDYHQPRAGQVVEVLPSAAGLATDGSLTEGHVAAHRGQLVALDTAYDPDTKSVELPANVQLPGWYSATPQLYLRVWEGLVASNPVGAWVSLPGTGLQVQVTTIGSTVHEGDFWSIAVRPSTPTVVYPDRLLNAPQRPDGLQMWACPLGIVNWGGQQVGRFDDCRKLFYPLAACCPSSTGLVNIVGIARTPTGNGYWLVDSEGSVFAFGDAGSLSLNSGGGAGAPSGIVGIVANPTATSNSQGYWLVNSAGQVFAYGSAKYYAEVGGGQATKPIVGMDATPDGRGYWLVASDGGVFAFGSAQVLSTGPLPTNHPIIGIAAISQQGYWLAASDGEVFAFGSAQALSPGPLPTDLPIVGIAANSPDGYWLVASNGEVFPFGDISLPTGPPPTDFPIVGIAAKPTPWIALEGYWLVASDGRVFAFGQAKVEVPGASPQTPTSGMAFTLPSAGLASAAETTRQVSIAPVLMHGGSADPGRIQPPRQELLNASYPGWHITDGSQVLTFSLGRPATVDPETALRLTLYWTTTNQQQISWVANWRWVQALQTPGQSAPGADLGPLVAARPREQSVEAPASAVAQLLKTQAYALEPSATTMPVGDYLVVQVNAEGLAAGTDPGVYLLLAQLDW
jgi:Family of unknown function (DUF6519)